MDGLLVYRQYLENIRLSINNFDLPELKDKAFMTILHRVNQIEDLSYIDVILKNAGLQLSFISDRKFLDEKVVLKSKLDTYFNDSVDMDATMKSALSDYMSMFISVEDEIIEDIEEFMGEDGIPEVSLDYFPQSSEVYYSPQELLEKNRDTLSALFGALNEMDKKLEKAEEMKKQKEEELGIVEEFYDEDTDDEELVLEDKDIKELISEEVEESHKKKSVIKIDNLVKEEVSVPKDKDENVDDIETEEEGFEDSDIVNTDVETNIDDGIGTDSEDIDSSENDFGKEDTDNDISEIETSENELDEDTDSSNQSNQGLEQDEPDIDLEEKVSNSSDNKKGNSIIDTSFLMDDEPEDESEEGNNSRNSHNTSSVVEDDSEEEDDYDAIPEDVHKGRKSNMLDFDDDYDDFGDLSQKDFKRFLDEDEIRDNTGQELEDDLMDEEDKLLRDTDPLERNAFEEATNYFLTGNSQSYADNDLKRLYKSKEKLVDTEGVNDTDDGLAKMVLALTDGLMNLPHFTSSLFRKAKKGGRKMRNFMIVEDDEDE